MIGIPNFFEVNILSIFESLKKILLSDTLHTELQTVSERTIIEDIILSFKFDSLILFSISIALTS